MTIPLTDWRALHENHFANTRILITGGAGFIGSHLAEALSILGAKITVIDDLSGGSADNLNGFPNTTFINASILDKDVLARAIEDCRYVFHQAALGSVPRSVEQPRLYNEVNTTGTLNVLEAAREAKVERLMFAASSSAYGDNPVPWIESMPVLAKSPYAANKVAGETLLRAYASCYPIDTVSLRYFNIFGPRQNANSAYAAVIAAFAKAILAGKRPIIYGDGSQTRDFTFVHNVVHANLLAARSANPLQGEVINVGTAGQITVTELAIKMAQLLNRPDLTPLHEGERAGDLKHSYADLNRPRALLNYNPIIDFDKGLQVTVDWYRSVLAC